MKWDWAWNLGIHRVCLLWIYDIRGFTKKSFGLSLQGPCVLS